MLRGVLVVVELLQLALLDPVQQDGYLVWVELADHLGLFATVLSLHQSIIIIEHRRPNHTTLLHVVRDNQY